MRGTGPIEKGATEGQQTYGNDLVRALKAAVSSRPRATTAGSKGMKAGKRRRKGERSTGAAPTSTADKHEDENWGLLEPLRGTLGPVATLFKPLAGSMATTTIILLLCTLWFRRPLYDPPGALVKSGYSNSARLAAYEEMWRKEESDLWSWLESRVGVEDLSWKNDLNSQRNRPSGQSAKAKSKERQTALASKDLEARSRAERMSEREMEDAIQITQERLEVLKGVMQRRKAGRTGGGTAKESVDGS